MEGTRNKVGQTIDQQNLNFTFPGFRASSVTQFPGIREYVGSGFTQNPKLPDYRVMQNSGNFSGMNQQGTFGQGHHFGQPMQQDQFLHNQQQQQQQQNPCHLQNVQSVAGNPCLCPPGIGQSHVIPCSNFLPQNIFDQIRTCVGNTTPIFILPNSQPIQAQQFPQIPQNPGPQMPQVNMGYPNIGYPALGSNFYPFPVPIPFCNSIPVGNQNRSQLERNSTVCDCCRRNNNGGNNSGLQMRNSGNSSSGSEGNETHRCSPGSDDTFCTKANCPGSINLQALASQLLSLQGVIPCAATRLVLRKVPGSNVTTSVEDTMERAQRSISSLNKEQLITEARNAQQVNGLINLHMTSSPPQNVIPLLTMLQLKVNSLKALVENLVNKSIGECQSVGAEGNTSLEPMVLAMKSDAEIRELLANLRQKECEERVNVSYAPYHSQRVVAESRLANFQNKISQVEAEIERRRASAMPWMNSSTGQFNHQTAFAAGGNYQCNGPQGFNSLFNDAGGKAFESPSPFMVQVQNPKRLNLKPNVGGPETTYHQPSEKQAVASPDKDMKGCRGNEKSRCHDGQENAEPSREASDLGKGTEGKKKLKIHVDEKGELSVKVKSLEELKVGEFVQLSPEVVIVIDKEVKDSKDEEKSQKRSNKIKKTDKKSIKKKSAESIPSDSTCDSETSVSSKSSDAEEEDREPRIEKKKGKSVLKNILKGKKKTTTKESDTSDKINRGILEPSEDVKPLFIKKEKHVDVVMLSEIFYDQFKTQKKIDGHESESVSVIEDRRDAEDALESSTIDQNEDNHHLNHRTGDVQEKLNTNKENAVDLAVQNDFTASSKICSVMKDTRSNMASSVPKFQSKRSPSKKKNEENSKDHGSKTSAQSLLKEAQNQTMDRYINSSVVESKESLMKGSEKDNKENIFRDQKTCSIINKKNRDNRTLEGSFTSSVDTDHRKRRNYRFK